MPRTLPWLTKGVTEKKIKTKSSSPPAPKRRKRESSPEDLVDADLNDVGTTPPRPKQKQPDRDASTSPARPTSAPQVEYMRPGADADDKYLMVEDEFCETAKSFTRSLHIADAVRRSKLAKSRGEKTLSKIAHGTDERTEKSRGIRQREEQDENDERKAEALGPEYESDGSDEAFMQDPQLAGLMTADKGRRTGRALAATVKARSNTRAAAGFMESPHAARRHRDALKDEESDGGAGRRAKASSSDRVPKVFEEVSDDEEDLDAEPAKHSHQPEPKQPTKAYDEDRSRGWQKTVARGDNVFKRFAASPKRRRSSTSTAPRETSSTQIKIEEPDDDFDVPRPKRFIPSYKKGRHRIASQQAAEAHTQDSNDQSTRSPLLPKAGENGISKRSSVPSPTTLASKRREAEPVRTHPPTKKASQAPATMNTQEYGCHRVEVAKSDSLARRQAERAQQEKEREQQQKKRERSKWDDIPTFDV